MKRKNNHTARKIWTENFGPIGRDEEGFSLEVHHIDRNPLNNNISNLQLLTIKQHHAVHLEAGDWFAAALIAKRIGHGPEYTSALQKGKKRPGIGGAPKGRPPWNKGVVGCFSEDVVAKMKQKRTGNRYGRLKVTDEQCREIINIYNQGLMIDGVGCVGKNGRIITYETAFAKRYSEQYGVTPAQMRNIISGKRNVISK